MKKREGEWWDNYRKFIKSDEWKEIHDECLQLAGNKCSECGSTKTLQAHHLVYGENFGGNEKQEDLKCLCIACHKKAHNDRKTKKREKKYKSSDIFNECKKLFCEKYKKIDTKQTCSYQSMAKVIFEEENGVSLSGNNRSKSKKYVLAKILHVKIKNNDIFPPPRKIFKYKRKKTSRGKKLQGDNHLQTMIILFGAKNCNSWKDLASELSKRLGGIGIKKASNINHKDFVLKMLKKAASI